MEGIVYNVNQSVIMTGQYVEEEEVEKHSQGEKSWRDAISWILPRTLSLFGLFPYMCWQFIWPPIGEINKHSLLH